MILRQRLQVLLLLFLSLLAFASYHEVTGGVAWLQYLALITILSFMFIFDVAFTNDSQFIFDPDADNWRRKVVRRIIALTFLRLCSVADIFLSCQESLQG